MPQEHAPKTSATDQGRRRSRSAGATTAQGPESGGSSAAAVPGLSHRVAGDLHRATAQQPTTTNRQDTTYGRPAGSTPGPHAPTPLGARSLGAAPVRRAPSTAPPQEVVVRRTLDEDIAPSYVSDQVPVEGASAGAERAEPSLVHRGLVETEVVGAQKYVRAYQTVYASVEPGSSWKDTHQSTADGTIAFLGKGDTWINFGNPLRALHYVRTYYAQAPGKRTEDLAKLPDNGTAQRLDERKAVNDYHGRPVVRSFLVPYDTYLELTGAAISEKQRARLGAYNLNVDKSKASDQYQILEDDVDKLSATALPGSLVSYVLDDLVDSYGQATHHGRVKGIAELSQRLGLPGIFDSLTIPMEGTEVPSPETQAVRARELAELHDLSFWVEKPQDHPQYAAQLEKGGKGTPHDERSAKAAHWESSLRHEDRLSELSLKYFGTDVLPDTVAERRVWRQKLAAAADAALIPSLIKEGYNEAAAAMHQGSAAGPDGGLASSTAAFRTILLAPDIREKVAKMTQEEIETRRLEAEVRARAKAAEVEQLRRHPQPEDGVDDLFGSIFDD